MDQALPPVEIPYKTLSDDALAGVIESFVLREGTDYGAAEIQYETKAQQVLKQIEKGEVVIVFDPTSESVHLLSKLEFRKRTQGTNA